MGWGGWGPGGMGWGGREVLVLVVVFSTARDI